MPLQTECSRPHRGPQPCQCNPVVLLVLCRCRSVACTGRCHHPVSTQTRGSKTMCTHKGVPWCTNERRWQVVLQRMQNHPTSDDDFHSVCSAQCWSVEPHTRVSDTVVNVSPTRLRRVVAQQRSPSTSSQREQQKKNQHRSTVRTVEKSREMICSQVMSIEWLRGRGGAREGTSDQSRQPVHSMSSA